MSITKIRGRSQIMDNTLDVGRMEVEFLNSSTGNWDITNSGLGATITGIPDPVNDYDVANKRYTDAVAAGLDWKESCQFTTSTGINVAVYTSTGGTGSSGSFTDVDFTGSSAFDLGAHSVAIDDRVLVKNQTDAKQNGIYIVTSIGAAGGLERAEDQDGTPGSEVSSGNASFVENGTIYAQTGWVLQGDGVLTLNTDDLSWVQFSGVGTYTAGDGLDLVGNEFSVDVSDFAGTGLQDDGFNNLEVIYAGSGSADSASRSDHDHSGTYAEETFKTIATDNGTSPVADSITDTLTLQSSSGVVVITGDAAADSVDFDIAVDGIKDTHIDWGTGAGQVSAADVPVDSSGFSSELGIGDTDVQTALNTLDAHDHDDQYAPLSHTHVPGDITGFDEAAQDAVGGMLTDSDTIDFTYDDGANTITAIVKTDSIDETHIDWGTSTGQVSAVDVPIADAGDYFTATDVEAALQELAQNAAEEVFGEAPTVTHGSPTTGALANIPIVGDTQRIFLNGIRQVEGISDDYTINDTTGVITFNFNLLNTPGHQDLVICDYKY